MIRYVLANQATVAKRRVYFHLVAGDGVTAATGEAAGQPQISTNGAAWTNTGIGTLTAIGNGRYYADLTQAAVATTGDSIETRYKSANTAEIPGDSVRVMAFDLDAVGAFSVTVTSPVASDGSITIVKGDDYFAADSASIDFAISGQPSFIGATSVKLSFRKTTAGPADANDLQVTGSVLSATQLRFEPTAAQTTTLTAGDAAYRYDVQVTLANGHVRTVQIGVATVRQDYS